MARSKTKNHATLKASAQSSEEQYSRTIDLSEASEIACQPAGVEAETQPAKGDCLNLETNSRCEAAVIEVEAVTALADDFNFMLDHQEIEAPLEQEYLWLSEASDVHENQDQLEQRLELEAMDSEVTSEPEVVLLNYRLEAKLAAVEPQIDVTKPMRRKANQLIVVESESDRPDYRAPKSDSLNLDAVCHRLEATATEIESRLEQLWTGFESNVSSRLSKILQALDRLPQCVNENQIGHQTSARESNRLKESEAAPGQMSWETRKRQMLSEFGMAQDEIEQMVPNQTESRLSSNVESGALEALHCSIETLDKIDSGINSEEIDCLKEQLTSQLRGAEVELSINRAKLCKEWAALEQRTTELNQRESTLKSKYNQTQTTAKHGLLDRIARHLSRKG